MLIAATEAADSSIKLFLLVSILTIFGCKVTLTTRIGWLFPAGFIFFFLLLIDEESVDYWRWDCWSNTCFVP